MAAQDTLQKLWLHGKAGGMAAREQLKAWALREAWLDGGIATACPRPACGPGWQAGQVSERGVDPGTELACVGASTHTRNDALQK